MGDNIRRASIIIALEKLRRSLQPGYEASTSNTTRQPHRQGGESGAEWIHRVLHETPTSYKEQLRLDKDMFRQLVNLMVERNLLKSGRYISVDEQVAIWLYILAKGQSYRDTSNTFKHSISTISKYFRLVLDALVSLSFDIVRPHRDLEEVPPEVQDSTRYWPYFKDAIGALDGTHVEAIVSDANGVQFRNRKGIKSWNVLASCSFDRIFTYINVGWEGSVHDSKVWKDTLTNSKFVFPHPPEGKYYLVDSGYPNTLGYLSPISGQGARVHMPEFEYGPPKGDIENYNYLHSSLRMKIECSFGQLKGRWKVLKNMPQISKRYQMSIIVATFTLHNFIRMQTLGIPIIEHDANVQGTVDHDLLNPDRVKAMGTVRDEIRKSIWRSKRPEGEEDEVEIAENNETEDHTAEDN